MRSRKVRLIGLVVGAVLVAALGSAIAAEGDGDGEAVDTIAVSEADQALMDRLLELEGQLPEPLPTEADVAANELDPVLIGSFTTARSTLDRLDDEIRQLYVDADDAATAVGDAISMITRGILVERQAYMVLELSDGSTNPRPIDASDARNEDGLAIDADGELGQAATGIDLLLQARDLQRLGYEVLEELPDAGAPFAARLRDLQVYEDEVGTTLRVLTSKEGDELLVPTDRFDAPVGVARATSVTYVCVDREAYLTLADLPYAERVAASIEEVPSAECADLARRAGLSLADQQAAAAAGDAADNDDEADPDAEDDG